MTPEMIDIARRAVASPGWRWMPGMRWFTATDDDGRRLLDGCGRVTDAQPVWVPEGALPDLTDPATLGCLLALVVQRFAYMGTAYPRPVNYGWRVIVDRWLIVGEGMTHAEAMVKALSFPTSR